MIDLTLNSFVIGNMANFQNAFGTKKNGDNPDGSPRGCTTQELTVNMMLPFMRARPITVTSNQETSVIEADASLILAGETTSLRLGPGAYHGVEVKIYNGTSEEAELLDSTFAIPIGAGDTLELHWTGVDWRVQTKYVVGDLYQQLPLTKSPVQRRWEGNWVNWTYRPAFMGLRTTAPSTAFLSDWHTHRSAIWHLNTNGTVATLGTKKYGTAGGGKPNNHIIVPREDVIKLAAPDIAEGAQVPDGPYAGYYVWQNIALAGTFLSVDDNDPLYQGGGKRPPFNGGVAPDIIRNMKGSTEWFQSATTSTPSNDSGVLGHGSGYAADNGYTPGPWWVGPITFDASRNVLTGAQNSPVNASSVLWRRIPG
jgi:hypothetical protein